MNKIQFSISSVLFGVSSVFFSMYAVAHDHKAPVTMKKANSEAKPEMVDAEVKKFDKEAKKITLKHAEIKNLDMPAMTMVFQIPDEALLEKIATYVKAGDKIKFSAAQTKSGYAVTSITIDSAKNAVSQ